MTEFTLEEEAILKVGEFIRITGDEVRDVKDATKELTLVIIEMYDSLKKLDQNIVVKLNELIEGVNLLLKEQPHQRP